MKKYLSVLMLSASLFLITGCFDKKEEPVEPSNSNVESNVTSNIESNSNEPSNIVTSNVPTSNVPTSNIITSNVTPSNVSSNTPVGNRDLACTMDYTSKMSGTGYTSALVKTNVKFQNSSVTNIRMQMIFELNSSLAPSIDMMVSTMKSSLQSQYNNMQGVTVTSNKLSATKFDVVINMDVTKMSAEDLKNTDFSSVTTADFEKIKASLVASGYTCN